MPELFTAEANKPSAAYASSVILLAVIIPVALFSTDEATEAPSILSLSIPKTSDPKVIVAPSAPIIFTTLALIVPALVT